jgi:hypothetical protein
MHVVGKIMKTRISIFLLLLTVGCGSLDIQVSDFPREHTRVITLHLTPEATPRDMRVSTMQYQRKIVSGERRQAEIIVFLRATQGYPDLKARAQISIDGTSRELEVTDIYGYEETRNVGLVGVFGVSGGSKILRGKIVIPQDVEEKIMASKKIEYTLYAAMIPIKLKVTGPQLQEIKEFLNY